MKKIKRFDMQKKPKKASFLWKPIIYAIAFPNIWKRHLRLERVNMEGLKPPYILLSNHHSFLDFMVMARVIARHRGNYVVALDGFYDHGEWLLRSVGCMGKRKFTNDLSLIKNMKYAVDHNKSALVLYPEARYSLDGCESILLDSVGKMIKLLNVPVVVLNMRGNYISQPQWNKIKRKVPIEATVTQVVNNQDLSKDISVEEINERIHTNFEYNDYKYQKERGIAIKANDRAYKLNKLLYMCPHCHTEHKMYGEGNELRCNACGKVWFLNEYNELKALEGETYFTTIPEWFKWERQMVREEVRASKYYFEDEVEVETLPNAKKFIYQGSGKLIHSLDGFKLNCKIDGKDTEILWSPFENYGVHIEYDYRKFGDALDISTLDESYWVYPKNKRDVITKISLATEEIYFYKKELRDLELKSKTNK